MSNAAQRKRLFDAVSASWGPSLSSWAYGEQDKPNVAGFRTPESKRLRGLPPAPKKPVPLKLGVNQMKMKKEMPSVRKGDSVVNALAGRASMKRTNNKLGKGKVVKKVKVPKRLRKQIGQVLKAKSLYGTYKECRKGIIATASLNGTATQPNITILGMGLQFPAVFVRQVDPSSNVYSLWANIPFGITDCANSGSYQAEDQLIYFHPLKILNAASVLWNNKFISSGWSNKTGNITTRVDTATGALVQTKPQNVKIDVVNSFVTFEFKNQSQRSYTMRIYHVYPKVKVANETIINAYNAAATEAALNNNGLITNTAVPILDPLMQPGKLGPFNKNYKYETVDIVIRPGETCKHTLQGPKNTTIDFSKLYLNSSDLNDFIPKGTCQVLICLLADYQVCKQSQGFEPGRFQGGVGPVNTAQPWMPVSVEVVEHYRLRCPETAGFIASGAAAGTGQPLTLRRNAYAFRNVDNNNYGESTVDYSAVEEEQPATSIAKGERA